MPRNPIETLRENESRRDTEVRSITHQSSGGALLLLVHTNNIMRDESTTTTVRPQHILVLLREIKTKENRVEYFHPEKIPRM